MMLFAFALLGMIALVLIIIFMNFGGSDRNRMKKRMGTREARLEYRRLAREADEVRRKRLAEEETGVDDESLSEEKPENPL